MSPIAAGLAVALALGPGPNDHAGDDPSSDGAAADAEPDEPPPAQRAGEMFDAGRYSEAAKWFRIAYEEHPEPAFLYGRAQALRRAGNCEAAIEVLEQFIGTSPPEADVVVAQDTIDACREVLRRDGTQDEAPVPVDETSERQPAGPEDGTPWRTDLAGGLLLGGGLVTLSLGAALTGSAFAVAEPRPEPESAFVRRQDRARAMTTAGIVLMASGSAVLIGAIVRYAFVARRGKRTAWQGPSPLVRF